jgi:signal transduction histidine kinase/DNA-binding response OmpR family regulator
MKLANRFNLFLIPVALIFAAWSIGLGWVEYQDRTTQFAEDAMNLNQDELSLLQQNQLFLYYFDNVSLGYIQDMQRDLADIKQEFHRTIKNAKLQRRDPLRFAFYSRNRELQVGVFTGKDLSIPDKKSTEVLQTLMEFQQNTPAKAVSRLIADIHHTLIPLGDDLDGNGLLIGDELKGYLQSSYRLPIKAFRDQAFNHFVIQVRTSTIQMVIMILLLLWIGRSVPRPFNHFIDRVSDVSNQSFNIPFETEWSIEELRVLAHSLEEMRKEIQRQQSELIQTRDEALAATEAKTQFLAAMSHEIRTPMNGVLGMADLLTSTPLNDKQQQYVNVIRSSGHTLLNIINDILDFSKIEVGKIILENVPFRLREMIHELDMMFNLQIQMRNISMHVDLDPCIPEVIVGDSHRLRQVLFNLLGNAVKFTNNGQITIRIHLQSMSPSATTISFSVADTGVGIEPHKVKRLFQPFEQGDKSTSRKFGGTGLGLSISDRLVGMMGGKIEVQSLLHIGSTFSFSIDFGVSGEHHSEEDKITNSAADSIEIPYLSDSTTILVAEDDEINQLYVRELLSSQGFSNFVIARNGVEVLQLLEKHSFNLILMDCQMPEMDGYETTRIIRQKEKSAGEGNRVPIIALTANALREDRQVCLDVGMDDYLSKPLESKNLKQSIARWLRPQESQLPVTVNDVEAQQKSIDKSAFNQLRKDLGQLKTMTLIDEFLLDLPEKLVSIRRSVLNHDSEALKHSTHALKGSCGIIKAMPMSRLCDNLIMQLQTGDENEIANTVNLLEDEAQRVSRSLRSLS